MNFPYESWSNDHQTINTSTKGLHSAWEGAGTGTRFSKSIRGRKASMRGSAVGVFVAGTVAPGANCKHSAGVNWKCNYTK